MRSDDIHTRPMWSAMDPNLKKLIIQWLPLICGILVLTIEVFMFPQVFFLHGPLCLLQLFPFGAIVLGFTSLVEENDAERRAHDHTLQEHKRLQRGYAIYETFFNCHAIHHGDVFLKVLAHRGGQWQAFSLPETKGWVLICNVELNRPIGIAPLPFCGAGDRDEAVCVEIQDEWRLRCLPSTRTLSIGTRADEDQVTIQDFGPFNGQMITLAQQQLFFFTRVDEACDAYFRWRQPDQICDHA